MQPEGAARRPGVLSRLFRWLGGLFADFVYGLAWLFEPPRSELPEAPPAYTVPAPRIDAPAVPAAPAAAPAEPALPVKEPGRGRGGLRHFVKFFLAKGVGAFVEQAIQFLVFAFAFHASYAVAGLGAGATFLTRLISQAAGKPAEKKLEQILESSLQRPAPGAVAPAPARTHFVPPVTLDRAKVATSTPDHAL